MDAVASMLRGGRMWTRGSSKKCHASKELGRGGRRDLGPVGGGGRAGPATLPSRRTHMRERGRPLRVRGSGRGRVGC